MRRLPTELAHARVRPSVILAGGTFLVAHCGGVTAVTLPRRNWRRILRLDERREPAVARCGSCSAPAARSVVVPCDCEDPRYPGGIKDAPWCSRFLISLAGHAHEVCLGCGRERIVAFPIAPPSSVNCRCVVVAAGAA